ncbi:BMP family ABC transporter substrate-binding protein [Natronorubrum sp. JWXQ-INN-674]|uniref:BMP family ABC transporter substrate-binding protein n=1 Tax=Natronorubrum halalkaliphilum TaxID=2691917 RepID=A0A6B0VLJ3_9EURY|nr:BMP family protein [Natronorubrum halalkaliphilum]MXV62440.1 BMP family ABC transporter substrate-binding protein [Natronorubrum halalkaliphilum]
MPRDRRTVLKGAGVAGLTAMAGCVGGFGDEAEDTEARVGMVYATGGLGDNSFNDMAQEGVLTAQDDYDIAFDESEPESEGEFDGAQRDFAESGDYDLISCIGFAQEDALSGNAPEYPDQNFIIIDAVLEEDNVRSYVFGEPEGSFQVGHLSGLLTGEEFSAGDGETNTDADVVGFVGGVESPLIQSFEAGFEAGVEHANEDADVVSSYVGDFNDTAGGQEAALSMYQDHDADIVFHAAGATGVGVFQAAESEGRFAIGVDADQSLTESDYADVILASMVKQVDTAVYTAVESVVNDEFEGGEVEELGLEEDGVAAVYGDTIGDEIPDDVKDQLEESRQAIIDGEIDVPQEP